ncbi:alpha/beta hydrolase [Halorubrum sp. AD140]|uniref:alpha/beta fold hydrolase n=1 Tax=Halorubrum sp. AD140 TaxID=3050073 RepID=UPI002ACC5333|nr:alpha/beta hydrolase [Halorubrum sp. AD140]MDZ5812624.1 alpha/beta hydrolase [Halorubrum sp. AD140]
MWSRKIQVPPKRKEGPHPNDGRIRETIEMKKASHNQGASDTESEFVRTNDIETYYVRRGDGPPIVFIHGMTMSATQWEPQMEALDGEFTTIAYDVRGHGRTGGSDRDPYNMSLYAADLDALLTELNVENPVLCGLSMGGCIAQVYAATYPEKIAGLVVSDTFTAAPLPLKGRLIFANLRFFGLLDRVVRYTILNRLQTWVGQRLAPGIAGDSVTTQRLMDEAPTISHAEFVKIANSVAQFPESDFDASKITVPALVMHGENVPPVLQDMHKKLAAQLTNADVENSVIPDAGHASNIDNPTFFSAVLREFVVQQVLK